MTRKSPASPSTAGAPAVSPLLLAVRTGLDALSWVAPPLAGRVALRLFATPQRYPAPRREQTVLAEAAAFTVPVAGRNLAAWSWGTGPAVLLVHGWSGRGAQLGALVDPLVAAGRRVVTFDLPAHGQSAGERSSLFDAAAAIRAVAQRVGPLAGLIAHSFGAAATSLALHDGLEVERAVYIAPTGHLEQGLASFRSRLGVGRRAEAALHGELSRRFGAHLFRDLAIESLGPTLTVPLLVIHDRDDREVPFSEGTAIAGAWPGARLTATRGLGHNRILWNPGVVEETVRFLHPPTARPAASAPAALALVV
jgi:pimeloyl-ACP methyl ester carboxylesterase